MCVKFSAQNITSSLRTCQQKQKCFSEQVLRDEVIQMWCDMTSPMSDYNCLCHVTLGQILISPNFVRQTLSRKLHCANRLKRRLIGADHGRPNHSRFKKSSLVYSRDQHKNQVVTDVYEGMRYSDQRMIFLAFSFLLFCSLRVWFRCQNDCQKA